MKRRRRGYRYKLIMELRIGGRDGRVKIVVNYLVNTVFFSKSITLKRM